MFVSFKYTMLDLYSLKLNICVFVFKRDATFLMKELFLLININVFLQYIYTCTCVFLLQFLL